MLKIVLCIGICLFAVAAVFVGLHIIRQRAKRREESYVTIPNFLRGGPQPPHDFIGPLQRYWMDLPPCIRIRHREDGGA